MLAAFSMPELNDFYNDGFGWVCRNCDREIASDSDSGELSRIMKEGEAESKTPELSNRALAKWADPAQTSLACPLCGITETVDVR